MTNHRPWQGLAFFLLVLALALAAAPDGGARPGGRLASKNEDRFRNPRATVRTLFTAVSTAREVPRFIRDAVACLDVTDVDPDNHDLGLLATHLETILRVKEVDTNRIPDDPTDIVYVLPDPQGHRIALRRMPDGRWLFDRETVAQIPSLWADVQKHLQEKNREAAALNVPHEYASARETFRTFLTAFHRLDMDTAARCLDLRNVPAVARTEIGHQLAGKLKLVMDRHRLVIFQEIPAANYSDPYVWLSQPEGVIELARCNSGERKGEWLFSQETVRSIDHLFNVYDDRPFAQELVELGIVRVYPDPWCSPELWVRTHLPGWLKTRVISTKTIHIEVYELLAYFLLAAAGYGLYRLTTRFLVGMIGWLLARRGCRLSRDKLAARLRPTGRMAGVLLLRWGVLVLKVDEVLLVIFLTVLNPLLWLLGTWMLFRWIDLAGDVMEVRLTLSKRQGDIVRMLWPVGSLATKIFLFLGTLFHLMAIFSWDVSTVLTGLGIGGFAFALGSQDSLKNLFGSFTLIADRPFVVGEQVRIGDNDEGVVEAVGLRSTRIRTHDDTLLIVPNSNLTTMNITNFGRRRFRRFRMTVGVVYDTPPERLLAFRDGIRELIQKMGSLRKDNFEVTIYNLGTSAIEIAVSVWLDVPDGHLELEARETLLLSILKLAEAQQIDMAFPTQTVRLVPQAEAASTPLPRLQELPPAMDSSNGARAKAS